MHRYTFNEVTLFVSDDMYEEQKILQLTFDEPFSKSEGYKAQPLKHFIFDYLKERVGQDYFSGRYAELMRRFKVSHMVILFAHGGEENGSWCYYDGDKFEPIQEWINKRDKKYCCLMIFSCNTIYATPKSKNCLLVVPDRVVGFKDIENSAATFTLIHPKHGEIDDYTVENFLSSKK